MDRLSLVVVRNPFDRAARETTLLDCAPAATLAELHARFLPPEIEAVASVNGQIVPREQWAATQFRPGDQLVFVPAVQGSDSLRLVAFLALSFYAPMIAGSMYETFGITTAFGQFAMTMATFMVGGALINHLLPPPKPQVPTLDAGSDASPAYSWTPVTTQQQGLPVARWYGKNKLFGNIVGAYITDDGNKQHVNALIDLGQGPLQAVGVLSDGSYNFWINGQPVRNADGTEHFQGVTLETRRGDMDQSSLPGFNVTRTAYATSVKVVNGTPYIYTTTGSAFDGLDIEITFPQGLFYSNDSGGLDAYSVNVQIETRKHGSSDPWIVLTKSYVDITTLTNGPHWSKGRWRLNGWNNEDYVWQEIAIGSNGMFDHGEGEWAGYDTNGNDCTWHWISTNSYQTVNTLVDYTVMSAAQTQPLRRVFNSSNLPHGQYDIRVTNLSPDQTTTRYGDDLYLTTVTEILNEDFQYPRTALVAVKALATDQLSGSLQFSCLCECLKVRVWNGSAWSVAYSNNPAWVCWDVLTQPVLDNGLNVVRYDGLDPARLDLAAFYAWAQWCDGIVTDGNGGTEKRCLFDGGFDAETTLWEAAQRIAQTARAVVIPLGAKITVHWDRPQTVPAQLFSVGNAGAGSFKETFLPMADRASEIEVDFVNAAADYNRDKLTVVNTGSSGVSNKINLSLFGVNRASQAWREAMYRLYRNQYLQRTGEISADIDAIACTIGDLIYLQHDVPQWGQGGRLVAATTGSVTLDQTVTIASGKTYEVAVRLSDDSIITRAVTSAPGDYTVLTVTPAFAAAPAQYDPYAFGETSKSNKPALVTAIRRSADQQAVISWVEYNASIYNVDTDQPALPTANYSALDPLPPVTNLLVAEQLVAQKDGTIVTVLDVTFRRPASSVWAAAEIWLNDGSGWKLAATTADEKTRVFDVRDGLTYTIVAATVNYLGQRQKLQNAPQTTIAVIGKTALPANVTGFFAGQNGVVVVLRWTQVADIDLAGYEIRYNPQGAGDTIWNNGTVLTQVTRGTQITSAALPPGAWTLLIKARDTSGNYSALPAVYRLNMTLTNLQSLLYSGEQSPDWPGVALNFVRHHTGVLMPDDQKLASQYGWEMFDNYVNTPYAICTYDAPEIDLSIDATVRIRGAIVSALGPAAPGTANPSLQADYRISSSSYRGFEDWTIGSVPVRYLKERISLDTAVGVAYIQQFAPAVDAELFSQQTTLTVAAGGTTWTYPTPYHNIGAAADVDVQATAIGASGLNAVIDNPTNTSAKIYIFNSSGTDVGGTAKVTARGA